MNTELIANGLSEAFFGGNWSEVDLKKTLSEVAFQMAQTQVALQKIPLPDLSIM